MLDDNTVETVTTDAQPTPEPTAGTYPGLDPDDHTDDTGWDALIAEAERGDGISEPEEEGEEEIDLAEGEEGEEEGDELDAEYYRVEQENQQLRMLTVNQGRLLQQISERLTAQERLAHENYATAQAAEEAARLPDPQDEPAAHLIARLERLESMLGETQQARLEDRQTAESERALAAANQQIAHSINRGISDIPGFNEGAQHLLGSRAWEWRRDNPALTDAQAQTQAQQELQQYLYTAYAQGTDPAQAVVELAGRYGMDWDSWAASSEEEDEAEPAVSQRRPARLSNAQRWSTPQPRTGAGAAGAISLDEVMAMPLDEFTKTFSGFDAAGERRWAEMLDEVESNQPWTWG